MVSDGLVPGIPPSPMDYQSLVLPAAIDHLGPLQPDMVCGLTEPCSALRTGEALHTRNSNLNLDAIRGDQPNTLWQLLPQDYSQPAKGIRVIIQSLDF